MNSNTRTMGALRLGLAALAALALSLAPALFSVSRAIAQSDEPYGVQPQSSYSVAQDTDADSDSADQDAQNAQAAQDAADQAEQALQDATEKRDELEGDNAPQDQIDAANQAIAQARAQKEAADEALQRPDQSQSQNQDQ